MKKPIIIYRNNLGTYSETFIYEQAKKLQKYRPQFLGIKQQNNKLLQSKPMLIRQKSPLGYLAELRFRLTGEAPPIERALRKIRPKLIHAYFGPDGAAILPLAKKLSLPLIISYLGYDATIEKGTKKSVPLSYQLYNYQKHRLHTYPILILALSQFIKKKLIEQGFSKKEIQVHHMGIDTEFFTPQKIARENSILFVGRLVESKGCSYLLDAMKYIQARFPEVKLMIIGDGQLRKQLEQYAKAIHINARFLGALPPAQVKHWMNRAKVFCVPSVTTANGTAEGLGMVFLEAQAMGLPVVSTQTGGIPEAVLQNKTGFLVPEKNSKQLAEQSILLLSDKKIWNAMSKEGRRWVKKQFDLKKQTLKLEKIYDMLS